MARNARTISSTRRPDARYENATAGNLAMDPELEARLRAHREARMQERKNAKKAQRTEHRAPRPETKRPSESSERLRAASEAALGQHVAAGEKKTPAKPAKAPAKADARRRALRRKQALVVAALCASVVMLFGAVLGTLLQKAQLSALTLEINTRRSAVDAQSKLNDELAAKLDMGDDLSAIRDRAIAEFGMGIPAVDHVRQFTLPEIPEEGVDVTMPDVSGAEAGSYSSAPELR